MKFFEILHHPVQIYNSTFQHKARSIKNGSDEKYAKGPYENAQTQSL